MCQSRQAPPIIACQAVRDPQKCQTAGSWKPQQKHSAKIPLYDQEGPSDDGGLCDFGATRVCAEHMLCKPIVLQ